jgi:hypothetical protein
VERRPPAMSDDERVLERLAEVDAALEHPQAALRDREEGGLRPRRIRPFLSGQEERRAVEPLARGLVSALSCAAPALFKRTISCNSSTLWLQRQRSRAVSR